MVNFGEKSSKNYRFLTNFRRKWPECAQNVCPGVLIKSDVLFARIRYSKHFFIFGIKTLNHSKSDCVTWSHQIHIWKGLRNLAIWDSQEWQETAHVKSYGIDTSPKCTKYIFPYENGSSLLIKWCLEKPWGGSQSKVNGSFVSQICHENSNKPLGGAYLADFSIDISNDGRKEREDMGTLSC